MSDHTKLQHFIGGEWVAPTSGEYFESTNPATREVLYHAARGNAADVSAAVDSAQATFEDPRWRDLSQTRRGHLLRRLGDLIGEHAEEFARSESQDNGKLLREMRGQLNDTAGVLLLLRRSGGQDPRGRRSHLRPQGAELHLTRAARRGGGDHPMELAPDADDEQAGPRPVRRQHGGDQAVGVHVGDGSSAGRAGRSRPASRRGRSMSSPGSASRPGSRSWITLRWPRSRSPAARPRGRASRLQRPAGSSGAPWSSAANRPTSCSRTPTSRTPRWVWWPGIFAAAGQTCIAGSRVFAHRAVYDELLERVTERARSIRIGDPLEEATELGPLAFEDQRDKVAILRRPRPYRGCAGADRWPPHRRRPGRLLLRAHRSRRRRQRHARGPRGDLRPGRGDHAVRQRGGGRPARERHRVRPGGRRVDLEPVAGTPHGGAARGGHHLGQHLPGDVPDVARAQGFKSSGVGVEHGTETIKEYTRLKSVWINTDEEPVADPFVMRS